MKKPVIRLLTVLWLVALLRLTVFRDGCFSHGWCSGRIEWDAFAYYATLIRVAYWRYLTYLFVGNLVWFMPAGVLVGLRNIRHANGRQIAGATDKFGAEGRVPAPRKAHPRVEQNSPGDCSGLHRQCGSYADATGILPRWWQRAAHASPPADAGRFGNELPPVAHRRAPLQRFPLLRAALWGFLLSLAIETMQYILGSGISELDDLILNTVGAMLGYGLLRVFQKCCKKSQRSD